MTSLLFRKSAVIDPRQIKSILFDFDGTLCSDRYFRSLGGEALTAIERLLFGDNSAQWADPWMRGELSSEDIAAYLAKHLGQSEQTILSALRGGCSQLKFHDAVCEFAGQQRETGRKTALVTANMDVFTQVVVPEHGLEQVFDLVLNTADHGTLDKSLLWCKAIRAFGPEFSFASALLVEDRLEMITLFESLGGWTYRYQGDPAFRAWLQETGFS